MAIVQNADGLVSISAQDYSYMPSASMALYGTALNGTRHVEYGTIYRTQHEVRTVIDFLARNIAQIPLHAYERRSDQDRQRITGTPLAATLDRPDVHATRGRWLEALVKDLAIYDAAYRIKVRSETNGRIALVRVPTPMVSHTGKNWLEPEGFKITGSRGTVEYSREEVVYLHGYNPADPRIGLSPLETLRQMLAEQMAAAEHREGLWKQGARAALVIERPAGGPAWSPEARARFRAEWEAAYTGAAASGRTAVLEEGMTAKPLQAFSPRDAQYFETTQLAREIAAAAYGVPAGLLGLGTANYASLTEQHRQLYTDCLAPWLAVISEELEAQILPDFPEAASSPGGGGIYLEFQLAEKMRGSFEEQAAVLQASVGAPYLTRNEARARLNLPSLAGADELVVPLNVLTGGQASPQDTAPTLAQQAGISAGPAPDAKASPAGRVRVKAATRDEFLAARRTSQAEIRTVITKAVARQQRTVISKLGAQKAARVDLPGVYDFPRFDRELAADLLPALTIAAERAAATIGPWTAENSGDYLKAVAAGAAKASNALLYARLASALETADPDTDPVDALDAMFDEIASPEENVILSLSLANNISNYGRTDAATAGGFTSKTWIVTSGNPRSSHAPLDGQTVGIREDFSIGAPWPGHSGLPPEEKANCACLVDFTE